MKVAMRLRAMSHDVLTVDDIGLKGAHDEEHLFFARNQGRVFVSHDGDFYLIFFHDRHVITGGAAIGA